MERFFNTAGPQKADTNYPIGSLSRFDLDGILKHESLPKPIVLMVDDIF